MLFTKQIFRDKYRFILFFVSSTKCVSLLICKSYLNDTHRCSMVYLIVKYKLKYEKSCIVLLVCKNISWLFLGSSSQMRKIFIFFDLFSVVLYYQPLKSIGFWQFCERVICMEKSVEKHWVQSSVK